MSSLSYIPVVDIDSSNIKTLWPSVLMAVKNAAFLAIDCELTGLGERRKLGARSVEDRYIAMCEIAKTRAIVSLGLSCFQYQPEPADEKKHSYVVQTFNILLFCDATFMSDPVSMRFLVEHGFDFNRQYASGVNYYPGVDKKEQSYMTEPMRQLFTYLIVCQHPLVLHNGLVDLCFLYQHFYTSLPKDLSTFVCDMEALFPAGVFDTKYMVEFKARYPASFLEYGFKKCQRDNSCAAGSGHRIDVRFLEYRESITYMKGLSQEQSGSEPHSGMCESFTGYGFCNKAECEKSHNVDWILDNEDVSALRKREKRNRKRKREQQRNGSNEPSNTSMETDSNDCEDSLEKDMENELQTSPVNGVSHIDTELNDGLSSTSESSEILNSIENKCTIDASGDNNKCSKTKVEEDISSNNEGSTSKDKTTLTRKSGGHRAGFDAFMTGYVFAYLITKYGAPKDVQDSDSFSNFEIKEYKGKIALSGKDLPLSIMKSSYSKPSKAMKEKLEKIRFNKALNTILQ